MKICPNCKEKVEENSEVCANCGYDFVSEANSKTQTTSPEEATATSQLSEAVKNFDAHNLWQWFLDSWKHPMDNQKGEKWYGIVTFLVEDLLVVIAMNIASKQAMSSASFGLFSGNSTTNQIFIEVFFYLVLMTLGSIFASWVGSKFVYEKSVNWWDYTNRIAHIDNLSAIFVVIAFLGALVKSYGLFGFFTVLSGLFFALAVFVPVLADKDAKRDKFYGLIITVVIQLFIIMILTQIFGQNIQSQLTGIFTHMLY